jgi:hypothetical protein
MYVAFLAACRKLAGSIAAATLITLISAVAVAQIPSSSGSGLDPLSLLKNLTQEQQDSLLQSVLGRGT